MRSRRRSSALWAGLVLLPAGLAAQVPVREPLATNAAVAQKTEPERSPLAAAMLQAVLPPLPLGYLYAGELRRSLLPTGLMVGGSVMFVLEVAELVDWTDEDKSPALLYVGLGSLVVGYAYGIVDAADAARDHNKRSTRRASSVALLPIPRGVALLAHVECGRFGKMAARQPRGGAGRGGV